MGFPKGLGSRGASKTKRQSVRVEALFESFTENSITCILLAQGFARDMNSTQVRAYSNSGNCPSRSSVTRLTDDALHSP